jgi:hypothetical protein
MEKKTIKISKLLMLTSKVYYYTLKIISKFVGRFFMLPDQVAYIVLRLKDVWTCPPTQEFETRIALLVGPH